MDSIHTIRLRGPWRYEPLFRIIRTPAGELVEQTCGMPPPGRVEIPSDWGKILGADFRGRVRFRRRFHCPTGLTRESVVKLVVQQVADFGFVELNGKRVGDIPPCAVGTRFQITRYLSASNDLSVVVERAAESTPDRAIGCPQPGGLIGDVFLEIH